MLFARNYHAAFIGLTVACFLVLAGCGKSDPQPVESPSRKPGGETKAEKCRKKLAGAIRRLAPEELVTQSNPERSINGLNAWLASCGSDELKEMKLNETALKVLGSNVRATATRFTVNDSLFIRDCLLLRDLTGAIMERVSGENSDPVTQDKEFVTEIFEWVVRNVSLMPESEKRLPLGLFDVLMTGSGRPEDRTWIFGEALRQQQIDGFIVRPTTEPEQEGNQLATADWLVAVVLEDSTMLFDMKTGLPVVEDSSGGLLDLSAASIDVLAESERWKNSSAEIVAQMAAFSPRMLFLQQQLAVEDSAVLFEELTGGVSEIRPIRARIAEASDGLWKEDDVSIWSYPEERFVASQSLSEEQQREYTNIMRPFDAPFERTTFATESTEEMTTVPEELSHEQRQALVQQRLMENFSKMMGSSEDMFGKPSKRLLKTRVRQILRVDDTGVIQQLQQIRITSMESVVKIQVPEEVRPMIQGRPKVIQMPFPQMIREVNQSSTGAALYWSAVRQIELGQVGAAITTLMNYRRQYNGGPWTYPSMINQALALLVQERNDDAISVLKEADVEENPERLRVRQMLKILAP